MIIFFKKVIKSTFRHCNLPTTRLDECLAAMKRDSQGDTDWSKEKLKAHHPEKFNEEDLQAIDGRFQVIGLPPADNIKEVLTPAVPK